MRRRRVNDKRHQGGYALLALIIALMVLSVMMTVAAPDQKIQGQRETEIEMMYRGQQMAEAIARYYSAGKLSDAGLVVKSPPPPFGYLTELKKLRDGVLIGLDEVYFCRASAFIDPLTRGEWEPVRIGDPRLRKFFRAWQASTGRQIPPLYLSYIGVASVVDTSPPDEEDPGNGSGNPATNTNSSSNTNTDEGDDADDDDEDEDDGDVFDDEGDDGDDDEEDDDSSLNRTTPDGTAFVSAAYQLSAPQQRPQRPASVFGADQLRTGPIIGVATKARGRSVRSYFGINKYQDMIFIYIPNVRPGLVSQPQQPQTGGTNQPPGGTDANGDGIPDEVKPNPQQ